MGFKAIIAKKINEKAFYSALELGMKAAGEPPLKDFKAITATWENQPGFEIKVTRENRNRFIVFIGVESTWSKGQKANANDIFMFNSRGTSVRHALMTPDFSPKTRKGLIGSTGGSGGLLTVSKDILQPGIKARDHEQTVAKKELKPMAKIIQQKLIESARLVNWAI